MNGTKISLYTDTEKYGDNKTCSAVKYGTSDRSHVDCKYSRGSVKENCFNSHELVPEILRRGLGNCRETG